MVRTYKRYDKYYDPGQTEWIKEIPVGWTQKRIGFELDLITGYAFQSEKFTYDEGIKLVRGDNVTEGYLRWGDKLRMWPELTDHLKQFLLSEGDVLIGMDGSKVGKNYALVKQDDLPLLLVQRVARLRSKENLDPKFLFYCIGNELFLFWVTINKTDPMVPHITPKNITDFEIPFPPVKEQQAIVAFLDKRTKQIDDLIEQKEKLLALLTEKRTAIITQAVTKGLDPKVKMKDSGVEWLGAVPQHWRVKRFKFCLKNPFQYGANEVAERSDPDEPRFIRITDLNDEGGLRNDTFKSLDREVAKPFLLEDGDILMARSGATVGKTFIYRKEWGQACFAGYLIRARLNKEILAPNFCIRFLSSGIYWNWVNSIFIQATIQNISAEKYASLIIPLPPIQEQNEISLYLEKTVSQIDELRLQIQNSLDKLKEYRSSLITSAVTGQIDVRKEVVA